MSSCKACGRDNIRKTSIALVAGESGWTMGRVCQECRRRGLVVVGVVNAARPIVREVRGDAVKVALDLLEGRRKMWGQYYADLPNKTDRATDQQVGRLEGIDMAIETLRRVGGE